MRFILERIRAGHEELEHLEKAISHLLNERRRASGVKLATVERAIKALVQESQDIANNCIEFYKDADGLRKKEIKFLSGQKDVKKSAKGDDGQLWTNYYSSLKNIREYYKHNEHHNVTVEDRNVEETVKRACAEVNIDLIFRPDENYGRSVDLQELYHKFTNLQPLRNYRINNHQQQEVIRLEHKGLKDKDMMESHIVPFVEIDYVNYLGSFHQFHLIPRHCKYRIDDYGSYLDDLVSYLTDFFERQNPLAVHDNLKSQLEEAFETNWENNAIAYWKEPTHLMNLYLKPVDRLFSSEGVYNSFIKGKRYNSIVNNFSKKTKEELDHHTSASREHDKSIAMKEFLIQGYRDMLSSTIEKTIEYIQKRESRTSKELEASQSLALQILEAVENDKIEEDISSGEEDEKPVYNPLNLPLGWDGKPIPFWLYKLHGLGKEYKCEICGNYSYWGRKAFENHFQEWRHSFGMRCLKIPNTPHFKEITRIEDAFALYDKLKDTLDKNTFKYAQEAECEDSEGNLMNVRAYEDLKRQGLL